MWLSLYQHSFVMKVRAGCHFPSISARDKYRSGRKRGDV